MKIIYIQHLRNRLKQRKIHIEIVREIFEKANEYYFDNLRNHHVAVATVKYQEKVRKVLVAYDKINMDKIEAITTHPIDDKNIAKRLNTGRWSYEKKQS